MLLNISERQANVVFSTVLGKDSLGDFVLGDLKSCGIEVNAVRDESRPTKQERIHRIGISFVES